MRSNAAPAFCLKSLKSDRASIEAFPEFRSILDWPVRWLCRDRRCSDRFPVQFPDRFWDRRRGRVTRGFAHKTRSIDVGSVLRQASWKYWATLHRIKCFVNWRALANRQCLESQRRASSPMAKAQCYRPLESAGAGLPFPLAFLEWLNCVRRSPRASSRQRSPNVDTGVAIPINWASLAESRVYAGNQDVFHSTGRTPLLWYLDRLTFNFGNLYYN